MPRIPSFCSPLRRTAALLAMLPCMLFEQAQGQSLPGGFADQLFLGGWVEPVGTTWDANGRMYVWEKRGMVWIVENGVRLPAPLIDISDEVGNWRDHGCLGFALDPDFLTNGRIYLLYQVDRHHLMNHGTPNYNPATNEYFAASIMRITRYTAVGPMFNTVDPASRFVLLGETAQTGVPNLHESHSTGSLVFGTDGTLLATLGDGASYSSVDVGSAGETYWSQALADGIIRPEENVGAFRSQMLGSYNGKLVRLDPNTGNGVPSNPFYDPQAPRSAKSRVWALGLRNPFRMTIRPGSGSTDPADGMPGTLYIGDVGWNVWEDLHVCTEGGQNFGWPLFEGMDAHSGYMNALTQNKEAPNPLFDGINCTQQFFHFQDLLKQDTPIHLNGHPNPCDPSIQISNNVPKFFHVRPAIDWRHGNQSRTGIYVGNAAATVNLNDPASPVPGPSFGGNAAVGGTWITGQGWPQGYQNVFFGADYVSGWMRRFEFDEEDKPRSVHNFGTGLGAVVHASEGPEGCIYYVRYNSSAVRRICNLQTVNLPPAAVATQDVQYGPSPLAVQFSGLQSNDPEGGPLTYAWNFGDGGTSNDPQPLHVFQAPGQEPLTRTVTLTVTDDQQQSNSTQIIVSLNNTPPVVEIISFEDGGTYPVGVDTLYALEADVTDLEHGPGELSYAWRTTLHHNTHSHPEAIDPSPVTSTTISGVGCDGETYSYQVELTVTDAGGLSTTVSHWIHPRCYAIHPTAVLLTDPGVGTAPLMVVFDGSESYDPGEVVSYHWDFGDGQTATGSSTSHVYDDEGEYLVTLTVTDDDGLTGQAFRYVSVVGLEPPQCVGPMGSVLRQVWTNIGGTTVADLTNSPAYPDSPNLTNNPTSFQGPVDWTNNYGTRMRGYIVPSVSGTYVFTATSDDASQVWLSVNSDPRHRKLICTVPGWTSPSEFTKYPSQVSAPVHLEAGAYYYVEMLQKEGSGGDHLALWWQTPLNGTRTVVPGANLAPWVDCPPSARVRVMLQGAYDAQANLMRDALRADNLLPLTEPYTAAGFVHAGGGGGEVMPASMTTVQGANALVDWVLVELRSKNNPSQVLLTRSALLQRDGDVVGVDGRSRLLFNVPVDDYFISLRHRNHLGVRTLQPVRLDRNDRLVDLTLPTTAVHGTDPLHVLGNGKRALWAGNVVPDAVLKYTGADNDRDPILISVGGNVPTATTSGYHPADVNLDGAVKYTGADNDRDAILINIGGSVPTGVRLEQLP